MSGNADRGRPRYREGREALLAATVRLVARTGLRGLTYRAVAAESGTTHGLVSYHFGSRDRLIAAAAQYASQHAVESVSLGTGGIADLAAALPGTGEREAPYHTFMSELTLEARRRPSLMPTIADLYTHYRELTEAMLVEDGIADPDGSIARMVFAAVDGLMIQHYIDGDSHATQAAIEALREILRTADRARRDQGS